MPGIPRPPLRIPLAPTSHPTPAVTQAFTPSQRPAHLTPAILHKPWAFATTARGRVRPASLKWGSLHSKPPFLLPDPDLAEGGLEDGEGPY